MQKLNHFGTIVLRMMIVEFLEKTVNKIRHSWQWSLQQLMCLYIGYYGMFSMMFVNLDVWWWWLKQICDDDVHNNVVQRSMYATGISVYAMSHRETMVLTITKLQIYVTLIMRE